MRALLGTTVCKLGGDPAMCLVEEAICANVYRWTGRQTDRQTDDGRHTIALAHGLIKSLASFCQSVDLSVRAPYGRNFCSILMKFCTEFGDRKSKNAFVGGQNPMISSPILPQFLPLKHFQWEGPNTAVTRPVDRLWGLRAQTTCLGIGYTYNVAKCNNP